jgi:hypothetical protein
MALLACNDELAEVVPKDVCYSELRWIGGERGSEEMYPGRDCVGCHLENDGPQFVLGGTLYPYVFSRDETYKLDAAQSGEDCFGIEGITISIEDGEGQVFDVVTNRAGNFFVEGNPADFAKPFTVRIENFQKSPDGTPVTTLAQMGIGVYYGGCARCHDRSGPPFDPEIDSLNPSDPNYRLPETSIGLPGYYEPENYPVLTVQAELEAIARAKGVQ